MIWWNGTSSCGAGRSARPSPLRTRPDSSDRAAPHPVEEAANFLPHLDIFRRATETTVRHGFENVQFGVDAGVAQCAVHPDGVGQEEITRARLDEGGRKPRHISEQR